MESHDLRLEAAREAAAEAEDRRRRHPEAPYERVFEVKREAEEKARSAPSDAGGYLPDFLLPPPGP